MSSSPTGTRASGREDRNRAVEIVCKNGAARDSHTYSQSSRPVGTRYKH